MTRRRWRTAAATALISMAALVPAPAGAAPAARAKSVYFTFDDGPGPGTAGLLDAAAAYDAKVTLFYVGRNGEQAPRLVARAAAEGHVIGSHTYSHESLTTLSRADAFRQIAQGHDALRPYVSNCWRPPRWLTSPAIEQDAKSLGLRQTLRTMDPAETRQVFVPAAWTDEDRIVAEVQHRVYDGAMITLHAEGPSATAQLGAFRRLLPLLTARGYRFKALPYCDRPTRTLLAVGDELTAGAGTANYRNQLDLMLRSSAEPRGFNYRWQGSITDSPTTGMNHDGVTGATLPRLRRDITTWQTAYHPDVILLTAATADIRHGDSPATVAQQMTALLTTIRRNQPRVAVFVAIPPGGATHRQAIRSAITAAGPGFHPVGLGAHDAGPPRQIARQFYRALDTTGIFA
ncbi:polysaccharide deacetylase family protein [Actinoplanes philippinensis]|uniref:polysaccharide deacetylase family protein n=1 Tax=Actinoplanes philippinensis TaxID=35752 RepID=UPI0033E2FFDF